MKTFIKEIGHIESFFSGIAKIKGLPHVSLHEVLLDEEGKEVAIVIGFDENLVEALFFDENFDLSKPVFKSEKIFSIPVSEKYLGKVIDGLGIPEDGEKIEGEDQPVFKFAPSVIEREPVSFPLTTGIKLIDATLPIGRGQRELIIGDRKLGKSTLVIDILLNQKFADPPVYCIYVLCGQNRAKLYNLIHLLEESDAFSYTVVVAAPSGSSFASLYLAPFVGCTIGEFFRDKGKDALVIYDDLSKHGKIYRDIALLLERAPGRETYPGDIFSLHAALLERAAKLKKKGSLTALPIIETQEGDITAFIPTNLISITDGQIYLERDLFQKGFLPAINIGLSVSRIGSKAQPRLLKEVTGDLRLILAQYEELKKLVQLEAITSKETELKIKRGELILELFKQDPHTFFSWPEQVLIFTLVKFGFFDEIEKSRWKEIETLLLEFIRARYKDLVKEIEKGILKEDRIKELIFDFRKEFL